MKNVKHLTHGMYNKNIILKQIQNMKFAILNIIPQSEICFTNFISETDYKGNNINIF